MPETVKDQIIALLEGLVGKPEEADTLNSVAEYLEGRKQDIEATSKK